MDKTGTAYFVKQPRVVNDLIVLHDVADERPYEVVILFSSDSADMFAICLAFIRRFHFLILEETTRPTSRNGIQMPLLLIFLKILCRSFRFS